MSFVYHHAIIVTGSKGSLTELHERIKETVSLNVSPIMESLIKENDVMGRRNINGYETFMVVPDGSKEGWDASNQGDMERFAIVKLLTTWTRHYNGSLDWVEVQYGYADHGAPYRLPHVTLASPPDDDA